MMTTDFPPKAMTRLLLAGLFFVCAASASGSYASGEEYTMRRSTISSGGGQSMGEGLSVTATVGQVGTAMMSGATFTVQGGFWTTSGELPEVLFTDGFESGDGV